jgi:Heavy metal binding domain
MKKLIFQVTAIVGIACFSACGESAKKEDFKNGSDTTHSTSAEDKYVCPMDTDVFSNHPDTCRKCGMDLEKVN